MSRMGTAGIRFDFSMQINSFLLIFYIRKASQHLCRKAFRVQSYEYGLIVPDIPTNR